MTALKNHPKSTHLSRDQRGSLVLPVPHPRIHFPKFHGLHVKLPEFLQKFVGSVRSLKPEQYIIGVAIISQVALFLYTTNFLIPKDVNFSYAGATCFTDPVILPGLHSSSASSAYSLSSKGGLSLGSLRLTSSSTCIQMTSVGESQSESISLHPKYLNLLSKEIIISTPSKPALAHSTDIKLMPTNTPLVVNLDQADEVFDYRLLGNDRSVACDKSGAELSCDVATLGLEQSHTYDFTLERLFNEAPAGVLLQEKISTVEALKPTKSSLANGAVAYDKPKSITITFSKNVESFEGIELVQITGDQNKRIETVATTDKNKIVITFPEELARQAQYELRISQAISPDLGALSKPYVLKFSTSGGPRVVGTNIASYGVSTSQNLVLTFDYALKSDQNISSFIKLTAGGKTLSSTSYISGNTVTIDPASNLPFCTNFTISVSDGFANSHGITGGSAWNMNSRSICHTTSYIGSSVQGRGILAYRFGSGPSKIIFFGNMHGNEASAKYTLDSWVNELEANFGKIPKNRTIIVIPSINPDGLAMGSRYNARGVDLNRNFPDVDWQADVMVAGGEVVKNNGGTAPLSEPESAALASFISAESPRLVLSYHAVASVIIANEAGDSTALANTYASLSSYWAPSPSQSNGMFAYQVTGTMEGWAYNILGIPTLVIEQSTYYGNELYSQSNAMWAMATLP